MLTFQTAPLERTLEVTGRSRSTLYAASSARGHGLHRQADRRPPAHRGLPRGAGHQPHRQHHPGPLPRRLGAAPACSSRAQVYPFTFELYPTANVFRAGHRIRLDVSSSNFPRFDVNPNTGGDRAWSGAWRWPSRRVYLRRGSTPRTWCCPGGGGGASHAGHGTGYTSGQGSDGAAGAGADRPGSLGPRIRLRGGRRPDGAGRPGRPAPGGGAGPRAGVRYFDTAPGYGDGRSEENLGRVLRRDRGGRRRGGGGDEAPPRPGGASAGGRGSSGRCGSRSPRACAAWGASGWTCLPAAQPASWRGRSGARGGASESGTWGGRGADRGAGAGAGGGRPAGGAGGGPDRAGGDHGHGRAGGGAPGAGVRLPGHGAGLLQRPQPQRRLGGQAAARADRTSRA